MDRRHFIIRKEMHTACPTITDWILQRPWKGKNIQNGKAAGLFHSITCTAGKMHMPLLSGMIRMIRLKRRLCRHPYSAGFLPLPTTLNFSHENIQIFPALFSVVCFVFMHESDQRESEQCQS